MGPVGRGWCLVLEALPRTGAARGCRSPDESLCHSSHHHRPPGLRVPTGGGTHAAAVHPALVCAHLCGACRTVGWAVGGGWDRPDPVPHLCPPSPTLPTRGCPTQPHRALISCFPHASQIHVPSQPHHPLARRSLLSPTDVHPALGPLADSPLLTFPTGAHPSGTSGTMRRRTRPSEASA